MINKPINPSPYNTCVVRDTDLHIKYEIPNAKIDGCVTSINNLDSGDCILIHREDFDEPVNQVDLNIGQSLLQTVLVEGQEVSFDNGGTYDISFDDTIHLQLGDTFVITLSDGNNTGTIESNPLYIQDNALTFKNKSMLSVGFIGRYYIENDLMPNGFRVRFNTLTGNITIVVSVKRNPTEYSWSSFYWQTPKKEADVRVVTDIDSNANKIFLQPTGDSLSTMYAVYNMHGDSGCGLDTSQILTNSGYYSNNVYKDAAYHGSDESEDTSKYCYKGQLTDYYGYRYINCLRDIGDKIVNIGLGKCIVEIYDFENKLVSRFRALAYDVAHSGLISNMYYIIVDNESVDSQMSRLEQLSTIIDSTGTGHNCWKYNYARFYNIDDLNSQDDISGLMRHNDNSYIIQNSTFIDHSYSATVFPFIPDNIQIGDSINIWNRDLVEMNTSPSCYFRYKTKPYFLVHNASGLAIQNNKFNDVNIKFGVWYYSNPINYFYLYLYVYDERNASWKLIERSPMLRGSDTYEFVGLVDSQKYKVNSIATDNDGDEWASANSMVFTIDNPTIDSPEIPVVFNAEDTTITFTLNALLEQYKSATLRFYKIAKNDMDIPTRLTYAGGGAAKVLDVVGYNQWSDYNICNDTYYDYYIRVSYTKEDGSTGIDWVYAANNIHTEFNGASLLGLEKSNETQLSITKQFNILYQFDSNMGELNNELSREYINSFGKYPKELKGHQNYMTGSISGLLGSECKGIYEEPKGIRKAWNSFVDDDTIKLYRGLDGETMVISIDKNVIKPFYYQGVGIVNEVSITFKEIASANQYAIFSTATVGD